MDAVLVFLGLKRSWVRSCDLGYVQEDCLMTEGTSLGEYLSGICHCCSCCQVWVHCQIKSGQIGKA